MKNKVSKEVKRIIKDYQKSYRFLEKHPTNHQQEIITDSKKLNSIKLDEIKAKDKAFLKNFFEQKIKWNKGCETLPSSRQEIEKSEIILEFLKEAS